MRIDTVGVVGCGLMGSGIAEVAARSGFDVVVREVDDDAASAGRARIERSLARAVAKEKITADDRDAALARMRFTVDLADLADRDLVVEAIVEDLDAKATLFGALDDLCGDATIYATNTSSLTVTDLAESILVHPALSEALSEAAE